MELVDKDITLVIIIVFHMFKKLCRDMENIKKESSQDSREENYNVWGEKYTKWH